MQLSTTIARDYLLDHRNLTAETSGQAENSQRPRAKHDRRKRHFCTCLKQDFVAHKGPRSPEIRRYATITENRHRARRATDLSLDWRGVSGTIVYEPRSLGDVGLERDLVATADQSLSSIRWREHPCTSRSHEEDGGPAPRLHPWRQAPARAAAVRAARVAAAMRAR